MKTGRQMDVWSEGQIDGETDRLWMDELVYRQTGGWTDRQMTDRQSKGHKEGETSRHMDGHIGGQTDRWMDRQADDKQTVEWTERWRDRQTDGWTGGQTGS